MCIRDSQRAGNDERATDAHRAGKKSCAQQTEHRGEQVEAEIEREHPSQQRRVDHGLHDGDESSVLRYFYEYAQPKAGEGHFIHTYQCDGNPIPSFAGEPEKVALHGDIEQLALDTWMNLNEDNKVSLYVSYISLADGSSDTIIINKHDQEEEA